MVLFPELRGAAFGYVNLNEAAKRQLGVLRDNEKSPFLSPEYCAKAVEELHAELGLAASYGGWMEDRSFLWRGSYLEKEQKFLHLGVDFIVPAETAVAMCFEAHVVLIDSDYPEDGGWGRRVIVFSRYLAKYFIFAHLDDNVECRVGQILGPGDIIGRVGLPPTNGNWFPHLHAQALCDDPQAFYLIRSFKLDGYAPLREREKWALRCPDPLLYLFR